MKLEVENKLKPIITQLDKIKHSKCLKLCILTLNNEIGMKKSFNFCKVP